METAQLLKTCRFILIDDEPYTITAISNLLTKDSKYLYTCISASGKKIELILRDDQVLPTYYDSKKISIRSDKETIKHFFTSKEKP